MRPRKSDCAVQYQAGPEPLAVAVRSSVAALFGAALEGEARAAATRFGVVTGSLLIEDDGALGFCVAARVEAALRAAGLARRVPTPSASPTASSAVAQRLGETPPEAESGAARRTDRRTRSRRSRLYVPGDQPDMLPNAGLYGADCLILDLEDSVHPERKAEARILARLALEAHGELAGRGCTSSGPTPSDGSRAGRGFFGASEVVVRINPLSGPFGLEDLRELAGCLPDAILLPKCESAADVEALARELDSLEEAAGLGRGTTLIMPLVETARGVLAAPAIATASERVCALCFGAEDFSRDIGARRSSEGTESRLAREAVVLAAKAAGAQAIDSVYSDTEDDAGFERYCDQARSLGFDGVGLVHPRQVAIAHRRFAPSDEEKAEALAIVEALEEAARRGAGVASLGGKMIDAPVAARARRIAGLDGADEGRYA